MRNPKTQCVAEFCNSTRAPNASPDGTEFICTRHWKRLNPHYRKAYRQYMKAATNKRNPQYETHYIGMAKHFWSRLKKQVIR